jgi:N-acetylglutamate synthase-like GNAT family acetyltransferase
LLRAILRIVIAPTSSQGVRLRLATSEDIPALHALIEASVRGLMTQGYSLRQLEGALGTYLGVDTQLITDQTYFIAEIETPTGSIMAGCGGWSKRKTLFGADHRPGRENALLDPATEAAKIRAFFVHPDWARRGIGSRILEACEEAARAAGFKGYEMGATLTGVPLYEARGYTALDSTEVPLANGEFLTVVRMAKAASR